MKLRTLILFLLPIYSPAQELSGVWTGYLQTQDSHLYYELALSENAEKITGYSQITYLADSIENIGIKKIKVTRRKKDLLIEDGKLVFDNYTISSIRTKLICALSLTITDSEMILQGTFRTRSLDMRDKTSYEGKIYLRKTSIPESTKLVAKLDEMNLLNGLSFVPEKNVAPASVKTETTVIAAKDPPLESRKIDEKKTVTDKPVIAAEGVGARQIEILNTYYFSSDSLILSLYDNGTVDGDTVSVFLNNKMIVSKGRLSVEPIRVTVPAKALPGDSLLLVMYAENLGAIPPNTGLLIVQDGKERHEIRFAGDLHKSSGIILKRRQ